MGGHAMALSLGKIMFIILGHHTIDKSGLQGLE